MISIFYNVFPVSKYLLAKDLTREYTANMTQNTTVAVDRTFDDNSVIDIAVLDAAERVRNLLARHDIAAKVAITRTFPRTSAGWNLVVELNCKVAGVSALVAQYLTFIRLERQEILTFNEILN